MPGKPHMIQIRKRDHIQSGKPEFVASPGKMHVKKSEKIMFQAQGTNAVIFIPNANKFLDTNESTLVIDASSGRQTHSFTLSDNPSSGAEFPYAIYCDGDNDFAEGGSTPRIIID